MVDALVEVSTTDGNVILFSFERGETRCERIVGEGVEIGEGFHACLSLRAGFNLSHCQGSTSA